MLVKRVSHIRVHVGKEGFTYQDSCWSRGFYISGLMLVKRVSHIRIHVGKEGFTYQVSCW